MDGSSVHLVEPFKWMPSPFLLGRVEGFRYRCWSREALHLFISPPCARATRCARYGARSLSPFPRGRISAIRKGAGSRSLVDVGTVPAGDVNMCIARFVHA